MEAIKAMCKDVLQEVMDAELETELGYEKQERRSENFETNVPKKYRNGYSKKRVKTQLGEVEINIPRDRNGEFEPQIIGKDNHNADGMEEKLLGLYAAGMSARDISAELVSKISEKIMPQLNGCQNRPLEAVYLFVFMDAIHYKIRENIK